MSNTDQEQRSALRPGLYQEITDKIIRQIEAGTIPWVQPWAEDQSLSIPRNATTNRAYSGVNILLLWDALFERGFSGNRWLTFKQALQFGGNVRKGERGTTVVYADTFTPKKDSGSTPESQGEDSGRRVPFLKRFTVFNVAQCDGLPFDYTVQPKQISQRLPIPAAEALIAVTGAQFQRDDTKAYYNTGSDSIHVPPQESFFEPINFYRTALHELTHWSGAKHRLNRDFTGRFLTMATKTQQREWLKLFQDDKSPYGNDLKGWLFGGAAIRTKFALFDLASFAKKITGDLFSEDSFFTDANTFWEAQDAAIAERRDQ